MPFPPALDARIRAALDLRTGGTRPCPMCEHEEWALAPEFLRTDAVAVANRRVGEPAAVVAAVYFVALNCEECGYTALFNAARLGLGDVTRGGGPAPSA